MTHVPIPHPGPARAVLAACAATALALGPAAPATALPLPVEPQVYSVRGQYTGVAEHGHAVTMRGETYTTTSTFNVDLEGDQLLTTYCIDFRTGIVADSWYREDQWDTYPGEGDFAEPGRVHWILLNSYPVTDIQDLRGATGIASVDEAEALTATQAAIWHFSNGLDLEEVHQGPDLGEEVIENNVVRLYEHLVENAEDLPHEPGSALTVSPDRDSGLAGGTVGSFTVETSAQDVPVTVDAPEGVELVDAATGDPVTEVGDGDTVGFAVPADAGAGEASFTLEAEATVQAGRLFKGEDPDDPTQTLITAQDSEIVVADSGSAAWDEQGGTPPAVETTGEPTAAAAPAPDDRSLPLTGGAVTALVVAGTVALGGGAVLVHLARRRRAANGVGTTE
ncbi:thioester domain-containing protein [Nocardiopsis sp. CT-R113]|uniref:Thioester domain-containing protein n=1 Tax=Nocardiopsis codii TaxID=3065942 RepID=A0ABU7K6D6_9ACTN|nr:thioester domain-containing protein [Nocardiopsis sp. CT-R113]MEE2037815.1 thioester domain-containing protein [Nocardiopsis sp. CT-R113]